MECSIVDARGRSCPEPVLMTKNAIENLNGEVIEVLVDTAVAVENIKRFAENAGFHVKVKQNEEEYSIIINKGD